MNTIDLHGRTAVVTGAAKGIGYGIAQRLLASGATVCLWDVDQTGVEAAAQALQPLGKVFAAVVNVTDPASIEDGTQATLASCGRIDILVKNAGISGPNFSVWDYPIVDWQRVIEVNLIGVFLCCRAIVPRMLTHGYGRIVNLASVAGKEGNPNASAYSASKAGVIGLSKSLGKELAQSGILVNCIAPAVVATDLLQQMTPEHVQYMLSKIPMARF